MLRNFFLLSLLAHLGSLAATQTETSLALIFSTTRWLSLFALFGFGCLHWIADRERPPLSGDVKWRLFIYLGLWAVTVINAENQFYSALRWAGHVMIVISSLMFLPSVLRPEDGWKLLVALKLIVLVTLGYSYLYPVELEVFDDPTLYRGIFGNPNALGHMGAVGCLLFLHGFITERESRWSKLQGAIAAFAGILMLQAGARSSIMAFLAGFLVLYVLHKARLSKYSMLAAIAVAFALFVAPEYWERLNTLIFKHGDDSPPDTLMDRLLSSRQQTWDAHLEGFVERPILGWGFGSDRSADFSDWQGEWGSSTVTGRDPVNDLLYALESGGVVGLFAYLFMLTLLIKVWFSAPVRAVLDFELRQPGLGSIAPVYVTYQAFYCLAALLIAMFEFDNTAFAAGNFFAALMWISVGMALGSYARVAAVLQEPAAEPGEQLSYSRSRFARPQD